MKNIQLLWQGGKTKALTFSYDDGVVQDRKLIALMRENGLKGTFNLNSGFLGWQDAIIRDGREIDHSHIPASEVPTLYDGFEIAVHTRTHPDLCALSDASVLEEVISDRLALEKIIGKPVHGMAYPFGTTNDHICSLLAACGIRYARSVEVTNRFDLPLNPLNWACSCHHYDLEPLIGPFLAQDDERKLLTVWGHAYEFDQKNEWEKIESQLQRLGNHSDVWYATNGEIFDYISDFNALDTTVDEHTIHNERAQTIWFKYNGTVMSIDAGATIHLPEMPVNEHPFRIWKDA